MGLATIAASSALVLGACGGGGTNAGGEHGPSVQGGAGNPGGAAIASSCVPSSQVLNETQSYAGKPVTITGTVAQVIGQHAFTVAPSNNSGGGITGNSNNANNANNAQTLLAVSKDATQLTAGSPVQATGILQPTFDQNQAATFTGGNLGQGQFTNFNGKPYVQADFAGPISANLTHGNQGGGVLSSGNSCGTASDVLSNTQSYAGQQVTVTGTIAQVVGPHAVTIAPSGSNNNANNAQTLLAVAKDTTKANMPMTPGAPVQVTGTLQPTFDTNQATTFTGGNLDPTAFTPYNGKPYVQAMYAGPASANLSGGQTGR
jgi:hypothetical protein